MRIRSTWLFWLGLVMLSSAARGESSVEQNLFDGQSLAHWDGDHRWWRVEDNAIVAEIPAGQQLDRNQFLYWDGEVADFELSLEFQISGGPSANSGIQFRAQRQPDGRAHGYQADIDDGAMWLGRIYDEEGRGLLAERGALVSISPQGLWWADQVTLAADFQRHLHRNDWNTYRVLATGPHLETWINGVRAAVLDDHHIKEADHRGLLALQLHSGPGPARVAFRKIRLRPLGETPLPTTAPRAWVKDDRSTESPVLWHLRANNHARSAIDNEGAQRVVAEMKLVDGFQAELIAAEPDIHQPIAFTFDERGRIWVVEAFSYPSKQPAGQGKDRVRILEDRDGDGTFETKKTFCEGLNLVSGIELGFGGVWLGAAPELLFIADQNGDDVPDGEPQVLLDGFGYQDTHETLNSFTWGPDGWLYGNQGVFNTASIGRPGAPEADRKTLCAGIWRYHPLRHTFEIFADGGSNQWGLGFNSRGDLFMTHCRSYWGGGGTTHVIRNGYFWNQANANYPAFISSSAPTTMPHLRNYLPAASRYDSGEGGAGKPGSGAIYGGHSHVGTMIYGGDNWPAIYRDRLFTHNLHGHQINQQINVPIGSAYETFHAGFDLAHIPDPAYVAVDLKYGPDGAVYIIDWVDQQHCHNPRPEEWDRTNGRIYRVAWSATYHPKQVDLTALTDQQLVAQLTHDNRWFANIARRLLQYRAAQRPLAVEATAAIDQMLQHADQRTVLEAMWTSHVTQHLDADRLAQLLQHADDVVRAWAVRLATEQRESAIAHRDTWQAMAIHDRSPRVRLAIASAMPLFDSAQRWQIGESLAAHAEDSDDRFLPAMTWFGVAPLVHNDVARGLALAASTPQRTLADSLIWYLAKHPAGREQLVAQLATDTEERAWQRLQLLHFSLQYEPRLPMPKHWSEVRDQRLAKWPEGIAAAARPLCEELSAVFGDEPTLASLRATVGNSMAPVESRRRALGLLERVADTGVVSLYPQLLNDPTLRVDVLPLLGRSQDPQLGTQLLSAYAQFDAAERAAALQVLTSRQSTASVLLRAIIDQQFDRQEITALHIRQMHDLRDPSLTQQLESIWGKINVSSEDTKRQIARIKNTYTTAPLWAFHTERGREIFQKTCANCHPLDGSNVPLGPGLKGSWRNGLDYFLENIVDPNAVVGETFRATTVITNDGQVLAGLVDQETPTTLVLRTADKKISLAKSNISERRLSEQSLMPVGLLDHMTEIEVIELLKFLLSNE